MHSPRRSRSGFRRSGSHRPSTGGTCYSIDVVVAKRNAEATKYTPVEQDEDRIAENMSVLRGKTNTPASFYTEISDLNDLEPESKFEGQIPRDCAQSEEGGPHRVVRLMSDCNMPAEIELPEFELPFRESHDPPYGIYVPRYFYVKQKRPVPMPPLKAWRGYHGNVYFEPIQVSQARVNMPEQTSPSRLSTDHCSEKLQEILMRSQRSHRSASAYTGDDLRSSPNSGYIRSRSGASTASSQRRKRQMAVLDRGTVLNDVNENVEEDLNWIAGQESMGSLCIDPITKTKNGPKNVYKKDKICKGSVVRGRSASKKGLPALVVAGDKFKQHLNPTTLLHMQTQYSQSSQRLTMNSPVPDYHLFNGSASGSRLPPLEQLKANLRHADHAGVDENLVHMIGPAERMKYEDPHNTKGKPYIRYSAEIRKQSTQQQDIQGQKCMV